MIPEAVDEFDKSVMTQRVYERLRKAIVSGDLVKAGERINVDQVCIDWQVSKTPVRESLKALEQEGLVTYIPRRGFFAKVPTLDDLRNVLDIRIALELHALERGFLKLDRSRLREFLEQFKEKFILLKYNGQVNPYLELDHKFHFFIVQSAGNQKLTELFQNLGLEMHYARYRDTYESAGVMGNSMPEHAEVIKAILDNDKGKAINALRIHLTNVDARLMTLNGHPDLKGLGLGQP